MSKTQCLKFFTENYTGDHLWNQRETIQNWLHWWSQTVYNRAAALKITYRQGTNNFVLNHSDPKNGRKKHGGTVRFSNFPHLHRFRFMLRRVATMSPQAIL